MSPRSVTITRKTRETDITLEMSLDGDGRSDISTGLPFFDHMLAQTAQHGRLNITLKADGDLQVDAHHTIEDCGLAFGEALAGCIGDKTGLRRFGHAYAPLDESLARVVVDLSGRPSLTYQVSPARAEIGGIDADLFREFFQSLANAGRLTLHVDLLRGINGHHQIEAVFKAFGLALASATEKVGGAGGARTPSTKGIL